METAYGCFEQSLAWCRGAETEVQLGVGVERPLTTVYGPEAAGKSVPRLQTLDYRDRSKSLEHGVVTGTQETLNSQLWYYHWLYCELKSKC